jgi:RimJ/RimL family protein N-acetyltransferase
MARHARAGGPARGPAAGTRRRVHLLADIRNTASQAVAERAGFSREGVVRSCLGYRDGSCDDAVLFGRVR